MQSVGSPELCDIFFLSPFSPLRSIKKLLIPALSGNRGWVVGTLAAFTETIIAR